MSSPECVICSKSGSQLNFLDLDGKQTVWLADFFGFTVRKGVIHTECKMFLENMMNFKNEKAGSIKSFVSDLNIPDLSKPKEKINNTYKNYENKVANKNASANNKLVGNQYGYIKSNSVVPFSSSSFKRNENNGLNRGLNNNVSKIGIKHTSNLNSENSNRTAISAFSYKNRQKISIDVSRNNCIDPSVPKNNKDVKTLQIAAPSGDSSICASVLGKRSHPCEEYRAGVQQMHTDKVITSNSKVATNKSTSLQTSDSSGDKVSVLEKIIDPCEKYHGFLGTFSKPNYDEMFKHLFGCLNLKKELCYSILRLPSILKWKAYNLIKN